MKLTIGMASFRNVDEVIWTVTALRRYQDLADTEILVVDNAGDPALARFVEQWGRGLVRLHVYTARQGTAAPRDEVFAQARGEWVICVDSHVMLMPGAVARFRAWASEHPGCRDLLQGPILFDDLETEADAWDEQWSGQMYGLWRYRKVPEDAEPYEIRMMGLGLFACRRDAWLGFSKRHRGFGGEEGYLHEKFRQAGRRTLCLPWLKWWHLFHFRDGVQSPLPYTPLLDDKIRNYLTGWSELGLDTAPILEHFGPRARELAAQFGLVRKPATNVQIDPNGACGSRCWFCPVRYEPRPPAQVMPQSLFERLLDGLAEGVKRGSVAPGYTLWLSSYNDVLLDPLLEERLRALRARGLRFVVLTNGIGLLKHHRLLHEYRDVAHCYSVDLPAGNPESYARHTLNPPETFGRIVEGIRALAALDPEHYARVLHVGVNGAHDGQAARGELKYPLPPGDTDRQVAELRALLPGLPRIEAMRPLADRAGHLVAHAIDNKVHRPGTPGCDRLTEWLHVNSLGQAYTCCQDYAEAYKFADLTKVSVHEALTRSAGGAIERTQRDLCTRCAFAQAPA